MITLAITTFAILAIVIFTLGALTPPVLGYLYVCHLSGGHYDTKPEKL
jgi:hypothetical protein